MKGIKKTQITITVAVITIAIVHVVWPTLNIDQITLALVVIAVVPWLAPLLKSVELPGGTKLEFNDLERVKQKVKSAGLVDDAMPENQTEYSFLSVAESNPRLALAGLRIEIESSLRALAEQEDVASKRHGSVTFLMLDLHEKGVISNQEKAALADMVRTLNQAVHGHELDYRTTQWVIDIGPKILGSLNGRLKKAKKSNA